MITKIKKNKILFISIMIIIVFILAFIGIIYFSSSSMKYLPKGELLYSLDSESKQYKLNAYLIDGGAISGDSIRVELENIHTGKMKNIYWEYPCNEAIMQWKNEEQVIINEKNLNIFKDTYNWKR